MSLDVLLARLEAPNVTAVTASSVTDVMPKPLENNVCTAVTLVTSSNIDDKGSFEKRAAILEFDGGLSHADAEAQAARELQR